VAHHSIPEPEPDLPEPHPSAALPQERAIGSEGTEAPLSFESDLTQLAAKFASYEGGHLPAELSGDLALEVVLHEIVEQACLATRATGAAIILERDGEMVCRASSGANAPELGSRVGSDSGLTAACIRTLQIQRCEDAQEDERADVEACRSLGVRSVLVLPLLQEGSLTGVLEVFSPQPSAFGPRDEVTLKVLALRILKNLAQAREPSAAKDETPATISAPQTSAIELNAPASTNAQKEKDNDNDEKQNGNKNNDNENLEARGGSQKSGLDVLIWILGVLVATCALFLVIEVGVHLGWRKTINGRRALPDSATGGRNGKTEAQPASTSSHASARPDLAPSRYSSTVGGLSALGSKRDSSPARSTPDSHPPPAGGLSVYENGKEIFRLPPAGNVGGAEKPISAAKSDATTRHSGEERRASSGQLAGLPKASPKDADSSVLHRVEPHYPEEALRQQIQGPVALQVRIGQDASIQEVKVVSGPPLLAEAAIAAVKQWQFRPHIVNGRPVEMEITVTLNFRLPR
jgi:TonB family protein